MKFSLERVTQPELEPVTLAQMKVSLRGFSSVTSLDADITSLIQGAREWVEDYTGRALIDQKWRLNIGSHAWISSFTDSNAKTGINYGTWRPSADGILLRKSPAIAITSFATVGADGVETIVDPALYQLREAGSKWPRLVGLNGSTWSGAEMRIEFRAGYANRLGSPVEGAERVPARLIQAMKLWAEANYDRDEKAMALLLDTAERLARPERCDLQIA